MAIKRVIVNLGTVSDAGDFQKFSFRSPYDHLVGVSVYSPEGFSTTAEQKAAVELAMTVEDADVNIFNDVFGLKRQNMVEEFTSPVRKLDHHLGNGKISGYVKCIENTKGVPLTIKLYLKYEE